MRILHILDHSLPLQSGYVFRTLSILREQRRLGWHTLLLTTPRQHHGGASVERIDGWQFYRTPLHEFEFRTWPGGAYVREMASTARRLGELVRHFRPDVVHAHSPVLNVLPALWTLHGLEIPTVYEVRALWEDGAVDLGTMQRGSVRYRVSRALETFALRRADHVTTICDGLREEIASRGVAHDRITVIPNAVDPHAFEFGAVPDVGLRTKLGLDGATVLGFAGSFYAYEGLDLLIEAMGRLAVGRRDLRLLLVGGGPQEAALKELTERCGVAGRVIFVGRVPQGEVVRYYGLMDALVYPRHRIRVTEMVTPLKPLEAMAQGRLLIASDVGGHRELIRDGETGFLFRAGDVASLEATIESVLQRRNELEAVRAQARHYVESERTWRRSVARYVAVYEGVLSKRRPLANQSAGNA